MRGELRSDLGGVWWVCSIWRDWDSVGRVRALTPFDSLKRRCLPVCSTGDGLRITLWNIFWICHFDLRVKWLDVGGQGQIKYGVEVTASERSEITVTSQRVLSIIQHQNSGAKRNTEAKFHKMLLVVYLVLLSFNIRIWRTVVLQTTRWPK